MILITSGAYLQGEFTNEIGLLPPSFLPIGNKRLYEYQVDFILKSITYDDIYISIPESFEINKCDIKKLEELGVNIIRVPDSLSLGDSILFCWNSALKIYDNLLILHGDTLFCNLFFAADKDFVSVHKNLGFYRRASLIEKRGVRLIESHWSESDDKVLSGLFFFKNPRFFIKSLVESRGDFVDSLAAYNNSYKFQVISSGDWLDFGHLIGFYKSRSKLTTQRAFNDLEINNKWVKKSSSEKNIKIIAEAKWFENIPLKLKLYLPQIIDFNSDDPDNCFYKLEYLYMLPLSDIYVFGKLSKGGWDCIFGCIKEVLDAFSSVSVPSNIAFEDFSNLYLTKTLDRLKDFIGSNEIKFSNQKISLDGEKFYSIWDIAKKSAEYIKPSTLNDVGIVHGDMCFSNVLFDFRVERVKLIDPRGMGYDGEYTIYGDKRYDYAKLYHSVCGGYDLIISNRYNLDYEEVPNGIIFDFDIYSDDYFDNVKNIFIKKVVDSSSYSENEILAINVHLFLSMLPLHSDRPERQLAFLANALRLFVRLMEIVK